MMRKDDVTGELPGVPMRRGRPKTGKAKDGAARQAAYRARKQAGGKVELPPVFVSEDLRLALKSYVDRQNADVAGEPMSVGDAVDRILRAYLLRKR
jgi:hypothetical protein